MNSEKWDFPITGKQVSNVLKRHFGPGEDWEISFFDVPSGDSSSSLLDALREKVSGRKCRVLTAELCEALEDAPQVWILDMRLASDSGVVLYIEDGEMFDINLAKA